MKRALITGVTGQDGAYVARQLVDSGVEVYGSHRSAEAFTASHSLTALGLLRDVRPVTLDLTNKTSIEQAIGSVRPDIVIHLAAASSVAQSWQDPAETMSINALGTIHILEICHNLGNQCRFVNASSSEIFASTDGEPQDETTQFGPNTPYGVSKLNAHLMTRIAREAHGMHASNAILFNHESPLRGEQFVTRKITKTLAAIAHGANVVLELGNVQAQRDWGHAREYADALVRMAQAEVADDYVVATGKLTSVAGFAQAAANALGIDIEWKGQGTNLVGTWNDRVIVSVNPEYFRPIDSSAPVGNPARIFKALGWRANMSAEDIAAEMAKADSLAAAF